jgi:hypothetical protein
MRSRKQLLPFQVSGARFLSERRFAILADDAGLGRSTQVLAALRELDSAALVLAPTAGKNLWEAEIARTEGLRIDRTNKGIFPAIGGAVRVMTPAELLRRKLSDKAAPRGGSVLVIDELHKLTSLADGTRLRTKLSRLADAFVRADGAVWLLLDPELVALDRLYSLLETVGFMLKRKAVRRAPLSVTRLKAKAS